MSDYTKIVDYAAKDALLTGNPAKLVKGTEIGAEFDAIVTAVATKVDETGGAATNLTLTTPILGTPQSGTVTNLTGTASININGTVGATTPAAGAFTTLSATGVTTVQDGTALLPAIIHTGDPNTGVWFPAADTVAVSTGGTERMRIDSAGNVGIGSASLTGYSLRVSKPITGAVNGQGVFANGQIQTDVTTGAYYFRTNSNSIAGSTTTSLYHYSAEQITLSGTHSSQYGFIANSSLIGATSNYGFYGNIASGTGRWNFYAAGTAANYFAGVCQFADGTALLPSITNIADENTGVWFPAADTVAVSTGGTERMRIDSSGNVSVTGALNEARGSIAMHATTMDLWAQPNIIDGTSSAVTITAIANAPQAGARRVLYPVAASVITNGATFAVDGAANATAAAGDAWEFEAITTSTYKVHVTKADGTAVVGGSVVQIQPISASVGSNALTISASALSLEFRSATLGSGTVSSVSGTPANLVISSGSTLGTVSAQQSRLAVLAINNAGTIELAAVNIAGGTDLSETGVISTTAEGGAGAADSATVIYSTAARTNVAYRVIGYVESTQATAGTWATAPSTIQGAGGNAVTAMSSLGYGQTWQDVAGSRALSTTYYNTTGRPIFVAVTASITSAGNQLDLTINGVLLRGGSAYTTTAFSSAAGIVPHGGSYSAVAVSGGSISKWAELR